MAGNAEAKTPTSADQTAERPPDSAVSTSDAPSEAKTESGEESDAKSPAAPEGKPPGEKDPDPAPDDAPPERKPRQRDRRAERKIKGLQRKLNDLEGRDATNQATIAELRREIDDLKAKNTPKVREPKRRDFATDQEYAEAYSDWKDETKSSSPPAKPPAAPADQPPADRDPAPDVHPDPTIADWIAAGIKEYGDLFQEALNTDEVAVSVPMAGFLSDSDKGHEVYMHLAAHPEQSRKIAAAMQLDEETGRSALEALEARAKAGEFDREQGELVVADPPDPGEPDNDPKKTPSGRREPPEPPSSTRDRGNVVTDPDPDNESMDDYAKRRQKEIAIAQGRHIE